MEKLSIGILSWKNPSVLNNTLSTYQTGGLLSLTDDVTIYFNEITDADRSLAAHYGAKVLGTDKNVGIGAAFLKLAEKALHDKIILLEHDWCLIEDAQTTVKRLSSGIKLLNSGYDCIRYRSRLRPGFPHFSFNFRGNELEIFDPLMQLKHPHLIDSLHWLDPAVEFPTRIGKQEIDGDTYWVSTSRYCGFTNNPCMYLKDFYLKTVGKYAGGGIDLEGKISYDWSRASYNVAHGEGLYMHFDPSKFGDRIIN